MFHLILALPNIIAMIVSIIGFFILGSICLTMGMILKQREGKKAETNILLCCAVIDYFIVIRNLIHWFG